ncbi:MAG TPA: hypothetical protein VF980_05440 [Thermoanaerobaculia bacterium]
MIWREKKLLLIVLVVLLAANAIFFFTYRVQYENRLRDLDSQLGSLKGELTAAKHTRMLAEQQLASYRKVQKDVRQIYDTEWSTQNQRFTAFTSEVMKLAAASQLAPPRSYSFSRGSSKGPKQGSSTATEVTIGFNVEGTYQQVRRLINLLELSDQFIIIDQIGLNSATGDKLSMTIRVKTLFRDAAAAPRANQEL